LKDYTHLLQLFNVCNVIITSRTKQYDILFQTGRGYSVAEDAARIATSILTRNSSPGPKQTKANDPGKAPVKAPKPVSKSEVRLGAMIVEFHIDMNKY